MDPMGISMICVYPKITVSIGKMMKHQIWCSIFRQNQLGKFQHSGDFMAEKHILDGIGIFGQQSPVEKLQKREWHAICLGKHHLFKPLAPACETKRNLGDKKKGMPQDAPGSKPLAENCDKVQQKVTKEIHL